MWIIRRSAEICKRRILLCLPIAVLLSQQVHGQQSSFVWGFNDLQGTSLPECQPLAIFFNGAQGTVKPQPPYYMIAYEAGGIPTWSSVGSNEQQLSWTVNHAAGKTLLLGMVDANGNSGGVSQYTVASNSSTSCLPTSSTSLKVSMNMTSSNLATCGALQLSISGGAKPYTVTVVQANAPFTSNQTMGANDDTYVWVNNLSPGTLALLAISDTSENYGSSTPLLTLQGTSNNHCPTSSTSSSSSDSSSSASSPSPTSSSSSSGTSQSSHKTAITAGIIVGVLVVGLFGFIAWYFLFKKRDSSYRGDGSARRASGLDLMDGKNSGRGAFSPMPTGNRSNLSVNLEPYPYYPPPSAASPSTYGGEGNYSSYVDDRSGRGRSMLGDMMLASESSGGGARESGYYHDGGHDPFATPTGSMRVGYPPSPPVVGSQAESIRTTATGRFRTLNPDDDPLNPLNPSAFRGSRQARADIKRAGGPRPNSDADSGRVFQHMDAGTLPTESGGLEEIPPAYPGPSGETSGRGAI